MEIGRLSPLVARQETSTGDRLKAISLSEEPVVLPRVRKVEKDFVSML